MQPFLTAATVIPSFTHSSDAASRPHHPDSLDCPLQDRPIWKRSEGRRVVVEAVTSGLAASEGSLGSDGLEEKNAQMRQGAGEAHWMGLQAEKEEVGQTPLADVMDKYEASSKVLDVTIVGAGPAGLRLAASLAKQGLNVAVVGRDAPFTNNYGVWCEELEGLGLEETIDREWDSCDW